MGYYPPNAFKWTEEAAADAGTYGPLAFGPATYMQVGGEVYNTWPNGAHTPTSMVSDYSPSPGFNYGYKYACYERNVMYIDSDKNYHNASLDFAFAPAYEGDDDDPGLCGLDSAYFESTIETDIFGHNTDTGGYWVSDGLDAGSDAWGTYFYVGGGLGQPW